MGGGAGAGPVELGQCAGAGAGVVAPADNSCEKTACTKNGTNIAKVTIEAGGRDDSPKRSSMNIISVREAVTTLQRAVAWSLGTGARTRTQIALEPKTNYINKWRPWQHSDNNVMLSSSSLLLSLM